MRAVLNLDDLLANVSPVLSEFEITNDSDEHRSILREIRLLGLRHSQHVIHKEGSRGLFTLKVCISREHDMYTNGENLAQTNLKKK